MESSKYEIGTVIEVTDKKCVIKIDEKPYELDKSQGPVLVPADLLVNEKVKVILVNDGVRHIERLTKEDEIKMKEKLPEVKKEIRKIAKKIKADQFFSIYDKGFKQKVYMYKVGDNEFRGKAAKKAI